MDKIARWMGYTPMVNYTGRMAYFETDGEAHHYVDDVKKYNPKLNPTQFISILNKIVEEGAVLTIEKVSCKTSKYCNHRATMEIKGNVITKTCISYQQAIVEVIIKYLNNLKSYKYN